MHSYFLAMTLAVLIISNYIKTDRIFYDILCYGCLNATNKIVNFLLLSLLKLRYKVNAYS